MDIVARPIGDDLDLDELMLRVRDAATAGTPSGGSIQPQAAGETNPPESDLIRVLEAQGDWNEQANQSMAALVDCIRTLRDDWADMHARLRQDIAELSALVEQLRPRRRRAAARRATTKRRPGGGRRTRS